MKVSIEHKRIPVSVVIATLGGKDLQATVSKLLTGTCVPDEILVCIPERVRIDAWLLDTVSLNVVRTPCYGQVAQRAYGLAQVRNPYVLQMDDDIILHETSLRMLFDSCMQLGQGHAVAPLLKSCNKGEFLTSYRRDMKGLLRSLVATLIGGAPWGAKRMGCIDQAGIPYAVDRDYCGGAQLVETQWLPGGCVMCRQEDLIIENYFPFPGKAYSEDVIHSLLWRKRGVRLWVAPDIECCTHIAPMPSNVDGIRSDYRARSYVIALNGGSLLRCRLWFAQYILRQWLGSLLSIGK